MASADFWSHRAESLRRPRLSGKPYSRVRFQISPDKGRDLSPPKRHIYLHSRLPVRFCTVTRTHLELPGLMWFLYVTWRVLVFGLTAYALAASPAGFLSTVCCLAAVALTSC